MIGADTQGMPAVKPAGTASPLHHVGDLGIPGLPVVRSGTVA